ncbi:MAG: hypothetical protein U1F98_11790 [Verrucomicrobiota bacterium]
MNSTIRAGRMVCALAASLIAASSSAVTFTNNALIASTDTNYEGADVLITNCTVTLDGSHSFGSVSVVAGGTLRALPQSSLALSGLFIGSNAVLTTAQTNTAAFPILSSGDVTVATGGSIRLDGTGFAAGTGNGAGSYAVRGFSYYGGAGHGGFGGSGLQTNYGGGIAYDQSTAPALPGSGGGSYSSFSPGGAGGGALKLTVAGTLLVDGSITANGANGTAQSGGGSGGSLWIQAGIVHGTGQFAAIGGNGGTLPGRNGGGGGGGMIGIQSATNDFGGSLSASGGGGTNWGGAGTIYLENSSPQGISGQLILDNANHSGTNTPIQIGNVPTDLVIQGNAVGYSSQASSPLAVRDLLIGSNSCIYQQPPFNYALTPTVLTLAVSGNAIVRPGGRLALDGAGYGMQHGLGQPSSSLGGAGYGGIGGSGGGRTYGSATSPADFGSGGNLAPGPSTAGAGGGALRLTVGGELRLDGIISANGSGGSAQGGGGSGGSLWLDAGTLSGSGSLTAAGGNGGSAGTPGGGGGGRIAVYSGTNLFTGTATAPGGSGSMAGGAGTVYFKSAGQNGLLVIDNAGQTGAGTVLTNDPNMEVVLSGGAIVSAGVDPINLASLSIGSNSTYLTYGHLIVSGDLTILAGGGMIGDSLGNLGGRGQGAGTSVLGFVPSTHYLYGGGGHGGLGAANSTSDRLSAGLAYDSAAQPILPGSGGGGPAYSTNVPGGQTQYYANAGCGASVVHVTVGGTLRVDGRISENGGDGPLNGGGGGSGGSIWIEASTLSGSGSITANGGNGTATYAGGGGGGRISLQYETNLFAGILSALGGTGYATGGAGSLYTKANNQPIGRLLVDNGGNSGLGTPIDYSPLLDLVVRNGGTAQPSGPGLLLNSLLVETNGSLTGTFGSSNLDVAVLGDASVQRGGQIEVDGIATTNQYAALKFAPPGNGIYSGGTGSGAGYGGMGGASANAPGGSDYGSATEPVDQGSLGGVRFVNSADDRASSAGGGAIRMTVIGTLALDGAMSANGHQGSLMASGGGSGGSIWLTTGSLTGNGSISADGGAGELSGGGGGAGGRIAVYRQTTGQHTNAFTGWMTAYGGDGFSWGDDGSVLTTAGSVPPRIVSQTPAGVVSNFVSSVDLGFNVAIDPATFTASDIQVSGPGGPIAVTGVYGVGPCACRVSFATQVNSGLYTIVAGPQVSDLFGQPMSQVYTGSFSIALPVVAGTITNEFGAPVAGVALQGVLYTGFPGAVASPVFTDAAGRYAMSFVPGSYFRLVPTNGTLIFYPNLAQFDNQSASVSNVDFMAITSIAASPVATVQSTNLVMGWRGLPGISYSLQSSTNLLNWAYYAGFYGTNGPIQISIPMTNGPEWFFRVMSYTP